MRVCRAQRLAPYSTPALCPPQALHERSRNIFMVYTVREQRRLFSYPSPPALSSNGICCGSADGATLGLSLSLSLCPPPRAFSSHLAKDPRDFLTPYSRSPTSADDQSLRADDSLFSTHVHLHFLLHKLPSIALSPPSHSYDTSTSLFKNEVRDDYFCCGGGKRERRFYRTPSPRDSGGRARPHDSDGHRLRGARPHDSDGHRLRGAR